MSENIINSIELEGIEHVFQDRRVDDNTIDYELDDTGTGLTIKGGIGTTFENYFSGVDVKSGPLASFSIKNGQTFTYTATEDCIMLARLAAFHNLSANITVDDVSVASTYANCGNGETYSDLVFIPFSLNIMKGQVVTGTSNIQTYDSTIRFFKVNKTKSSMVVKTEASPIGTVIAFMGTKAPKDFLACDGTVYEINKYPKLARFFENQFGTKNHFGGDGTTTFAVPDLRGEFLRGTGTNGHSGQGNGATVGTHQNATGIPFFWTYQNGIQYAIGSTPYNYEGLSTGQHNRGNCDSVWVGGTTEVKTFSTRPTNTSVLYCIKYDDHQDKIGKEKHTYSTEEQVVGTWIDGKPLYEKTIIHDLNGKGTINVNHNISDVDYIYMPSYSFTLENGTTMCSPYLADKTLYGMVNVLYVTPTLIRCNIYDEVRSGKLICTLRYTKTTD